ncbi:MAG: metal ABC transporter substrate-binding protein [bacterium]|nr:metal ABC transporter substrate-binding protein [bacterium]
MLLIALFTLIAKQLYIVTSIEDLRSITEEIGKEKVKVESIAKGYQNAHFIEAKPSFMLKLNRADLFIIVGLGLEDAWAPLLIEGSRNPKLLSERLLIASSGCEVLEIPTQRITKEMGDVHPLGNPHVWLDPKNGIIIAKNIKDKLIELDPLNREFYEKNFNEFKDKIYRKMEEWQAISQKFKGLKVISYHNSWANFSKAFGIEVVGFIEPKPGIPPSPRHTQNIIELLRKKEASLIVVEPYFDMRLPKYISEKSNVKVINLYPHTLGRPDIKTYLDLFDINLREIVNAL